MPIIFADSLAERLGVAGVCIVVGIILIIAGINNVRTKRAEETGKRRWVNNALGRSNSYEGKSAVNMGYMRIVLGIGAIIFGIVFIFVGPFLAS